MSQSEKTSVQSDKTAAPSQPALAISTSASTFPAEPPSERPQISERKSSRRGSLKHEEHHSDHGDVIRDIIIGYADGLTVPFALTAGLSSYVPSPPPLFSNAKKNTDSAPPNS
jgi:hypothetical protein